ncbi:SDR family oxidoreductase [Halomonas sp. FeN2]|uniref:SDR family oxidoreductase n=1 Tax=Vreelandella neptunia TaxID=115551 RepID=A0ABZ0YNU8_9GAMM|nr:MULTISPECIES: SDR family oxidoreductase [Halomonas]TDV98213.1 NADP-dependent 3-hydroxy acid dehydrogenase YdfG [Halomonas alkaliantarctica]MBF59578.1 short-chain dehydrogenase [Halomonas sp.]MDN3558848.1 SDR family oxidoreductase [Halomonas neptunia]UBR49007.1 SDR family oxidoreductase [Halomonas sp. FeN2]WQH13815.1 SDR family oxidoreductase [Halomonas neptunia]|tara:strand:+ start:1003 stop:1689 length:687 start_codon:yes stop_codon:yes gene_type:complete
MQHRVLLITGASSGIGAATARAAAREGYKLVLAARSSDKLTALAQELGPENVLTCGLDVTNMEQQQAMVEQALETFGRLDGIFANAGRGGSPGGFSEADHEAWREMILTNIYGVGLTIQACLPALKRSKGHVLLTGSAAGRTTIPGSMYSATKWAVTGIGYNLREELRGTGMRVTLIEPGMVDTPFFDEPPAHALEDRDIANAVVYALAQPAHVDVNEILIRPTPPLE